MKLFALAFSCLLIFSTLANANEFLKAGAMAVGAGNSLVDPQLIKEGKFEQLTERAIAFRETVSCAS